MWAKIICILAYVCNSPNDVKLVCHVEFWYIETYAPFKSDYLFLLRKEIKFSEVDPLEESRLSTRSVEIVAQPADGF